MDYVQPLSTTRYYPLPQFAPIHQNDKCVWCKVWSLEEQCAVWWQEVWSEQGLGLRQGFISPSPPLSLSPCGIESPCATAGPWFPSRTCLCSSPGWALHLAPVARVWHSLVNMAEPTPHIKACPVLSGLGQALLVSIRLTEPQNAPLG